MTDEQAQVQVNREAEEALVGAVLINSELFEDEKICRVATRDIYDQRLRWIWEAALSLWVEGRHVDLTTVCQVLQSLGKLEEVGGPAYLTKLVTTTNTMHAPTYAEIVLENSAKRQMKNVANELLKLSFSANGHSPESLFAKAEGIIIDCGRVFERGGKTKVVSAAELEQGEIEDDEYIAAPLLYKAGIHFLTGEVGSLKTWIGVDTAIEVARGGKVLNGLPVETPTPVLYLASDNRERTIRKRLRKLRIGKGLKELPDNLYFHFAPLNLSSSADMAVLHRLIDRLGIGLCIVDMWASYIGETDENSASEVAQVIVKTRRTADGLDAAFLFMHHMNKQSKAKKWIQKWRGSVSIPGNIDVAFSLELKTQEPIVSKFKHDKARDDKLINPLELGLIDTEEGGVTLTWDIMAWSSEEKHTVSEAAAIVAYDILKSNPGVVYTSSVLGEELKKLEALPGRNRWYAALEILADKPGIIKTSGRGSKSTFIFDDHDRVLPPL